jgi:glycosyltransferase involved in cell wall biosynthesis
MKILVISNMSRKEPHGSDNRTYGLVRSLPELGCEVLHICAIPPIQKDKIRYLQRRYYTDRSQTIRRYKNVKNIYRECKTFSPDVIYAHQLDNAFMAIPLKYLLNIPLGYDAHSSAYLELPTSSNIPFHKKLSIKIKEKIVLKTADKILAASSDLKDFLINRLNVPKEKIVIIKNGADISLFRPMEQNLKLKRKLGISPTDKIIVFTCPMSFPSNSIALEYLFDMVPMIERKFSNIKFLILGGGQQLKPPSRNVIYTGHINPNDMPLYLNLADVCISPYPPSAVCGGTRTKMCEYFACGKPVVSTLEGVRGFDDVMPDRDFLSASDSDDFINKLVSLLEDEEFSKELGKNARKAALRYSWSYWSRKVFDALRYVSFGC